MAPSLEGWQRGRSSFEARAPDLGFTRDRY